MLLLWACNSVFQSYLPFLSRQCDIKQSSCSLNVPLSDMWRVLYVIWLRTWRHTERPALRQRLSCGHLHKSTNSLFSNQGGSPGLRYVLSRWMLRANTVSSLLLLLLLIHSLLLIITLIWKVNNNNNGILSVYLSVFLSICIFISLSLSLYIYIYIYI